MKSHPILFSAPMVRAILEGRKTQTRRIVKPVGGDEGFALLDHGNGFWPYRSDDGDSAFHTVKRGGKEYLDETPHTCPYGQTGDRLWVREAWSTHSFLDDVSPSAITTLSLHYWADGEIKTGKKRPSIHMPRWASRITLEVVSVRVERLQDISEADAVAEGVKNSLHLPGGRFANENYAHLWWTLNGDGSWESNPWVWVVEFKRVEQ